MPTSYAIASPTTLPSGPSREGFVDAVKAFKREEGVKLHAVFDPQNPDRKAQQRLLRNPVVKNYLTRPAAGLPWFKTPLLDTPPVPKASKAEKEASDYYEARLYQMLCEDVPFREFAHTPFYMLEGPFPSAFYRITAHQSERLQNAGVRVERPQDIAGIRETVDEWTASLGRKPDPKASRQRALLFPNWDGDHVSLLAVLLHPDTRRPFVAVFLNSWRLDEYTQGICRTFRHGNKTTSELPFVDASHQLQTQAFDTDCALYAHNFAEAAGKLVRDGVVEQLAAEQEAHDAPAFQRRVKETFQEEIKPHLRMYYDASGNPQDPKARMIEHYMQRWDLGGEAIALLAESTTPSGGG